MRTISPSTRPDRVYLLTGAMQGFTFGWGLAAVVWWVVELELSPLRLVLLGSALELTILLCEVPTGVLADVWSRKWSVCAAYALMGTAMMLGPITAFLPALLAWQVLWAIGWTMQSGAATAWVTDEWVSAKPDGDGPDTDGPNADGPDTDGPDTDGPTPSQPTRSADTLIVKHALWRVIGLMAGLPAIAAIGVWSVPIAMVFVGALSATFSLYLAAAMGETRRHVTASEIDPAATPLPAGALRTRLWPEAMRTAKAGAKKILHQRVLLLMLISTAVMGAANQAIDGLDVRRITSLGLPETNGTEAILFIGAVWFVMNVLQLPLVALLGRHVDSLTTRRSVHLLMTMLGCAAVGVMALALGPWLALAVGGWTVREVFTELSFPLAEAVVNRQADSSVRATVISFLGQAESLGQVVGGTALGVIAQLATVPTALAIAAVLLGVAALVYLFIGPDEQVA